MLRFTFPSSPLYQNINPLPGSPSSLIFTFWSSPSQQARFVVLYAISAVYFAGVMVRLMLTLTPAEDSEDGDDRRNSGNLYDKASKVRKKHVSDQIRSDESLGLNIKSIVIILMIMLLMMFTVHCTWLNTGLSAYIKLKIWTNHKPQITIAVPKHKCTSRKVTKGKHGYIKNKLVLKKIKQEGVT